jgi:hypothetical protein
MKKPRKPDPLFVTRHHDALARFIGWYSQLPDFDSEKFEEFLAKDNFHFDKLRFRTIILKTIRVRVGAL